MSRNHSPFGDPRSCAARVYCSRSCKTKVILGLRKRSPHSETTKALISKNRAGKCKGHPFWGNREASTNGVRRTSHLRRNEYGKAKSYAPDFWVNGSYVEVKGFFDAASQWKVGSIKAKGIKCA